MFYSKTFLIEEHAQYSVTFLVSSSTINGIKLCNMILLIKYDHKYYAFHFIEMESQFVQKVMSFING